MAVDSVRIEKYQYSRQPALCLNGLVGLADSGGFSGFCPHAHFSLEKKNREEVSKVAVTCKS